MPLLAQSNQLQDHIKKSPNFNKYDPEGSIVCRSMRLKNQQSQSVHCSDHSPRRKRNSMENDRKT